MVKAAAANDRKFQNPGTLPDWSKWQQKKLNYIASERGSERCCADFTDPSRAIESMSAGYIITAHDR